MGVEACQLRGRRLRQFRSSAFAVAASSALVAGVLALAPVAQSRGAQSRATVNPSLDVTFSADNSIAVTLADGTPVGSPSGAPTVIPAGYYTVLLSGPLTPNGLPYFHLSGPNEDILQNMNEGGILNITVDAYFAPNSTYTWTNDSLSGVVYTFTTSAVVVGAPPALPTSPGKGAPAQVHDYVGSAIPPLRGTLAASVSAAGKLTIAFKGKAVTTLKAGRYKVAVVDRSAKNGLMLEKTTQHTAVSLTGVAFVGKHTASIDLTAGRWVFAPRLSAAKSYSIVVSS